MGRDVTLLIIVVIFILISIIDIKKKIIPNTLVIILGILSYFYNCINFTLEDIFLGGCVYLTAFSLIYGYGSDFLKKECLGFGDVKLSFSLGILMTYTTSNNVVYVMSIPNEKESFTSPKPKHSFFKKSDP